MVTSPHTWGNAERITSANMNYAIAAIGELAVAAPDMSSRISTLEAGDVLPYYVQTITGIAQGGNTTDSEGVQPYSGWPTSGSFTGASTGVYVPTSGKYVITFVATCEGSTTFWNGGPSQHRVTHFLFKGYETGRTVRTQASGGATLLGASSTAPLGGETMASVTATAYLSAGDIVTPAWYDGLAWLEDRGAGYVPRLVSHRPTPVCTCRLTIVRIST